MATAAAATTKIQKDSILVTEVNDQVSFQCCIKPEDPNNYLFLPF